MDGMFAIILSPGVVTLFPEVLSMGFSPAWLLLSKTGQQMIIRSCLFISRPNATHDTGLG